MATVRTLLITRIELQQVRGRHPGVIPGDHNRQRQAIDVYGSERRPFRILEAKIAHPDEIIAYYMRIETDGGIDGFYGPIDRARGELAITTFGKMLLGQDTLDTTQLWDKMERVNRHSRHGLLKMAFSAVDNTLWDLTRRACKAPVWQILGGGARSRIPAYDSLSYCIHRLTPAHNRRLRQAVPGTGGVDRHQSGTKFWEPRSANPIPSGCFAMHIEEQTDRHSSVCIVTHMTLLW